jgi:hypothetical protein
VIRRVSPRFPRRAALAACAAFASIALALAGARAAGAAAPPAPGKGVVPAPAIADNAPSIPPDSGWVEVGGPGKPFGADDPFADLPSPEDESAAAPRGGQILPWLSYERVDQFVLGIEQRYLPKSGFHPGFTTRIARAGQGTGKWLYNLGLEQPLDARRRSLLAVSIYRDTDDDGFGQIGDVENALAALFFHDDDRDWFEREGFGIEGSYKLTRWRGDVRYAQDVYSSIPLIADDTRGIFRRHASWRANPAVDEGDLRSVTGTVAYDSRSSKTFPRRGMWHTLSVETAGGDLGGDFTYTRWLADLRAYVSSGPTQIIKSRLMLGTTSEGAFLPFQRTFAIGGVGTLRATPFRALRGRHLALLNNDWSWEVLRRSSKNAAIKTGLSLVVFDDLGLAWDAPTWDLGQRRMAWNAGLGVGTTDETLRVYFARDLRAKRSPVEVSVRIARSY